MLPGSAYDIHRVCRRRVIHCCSLPTVCTSCETFVTMILVGREWPEIWRECRDAWADESLPCLLHGAKRFAVNGMQHDDITAIALKIPLL